MSALLTLAIVVIVVVMIVRALNERSQGTSEESAGTVIRRFFLYALLLGVLSVVAVGVAGLIEALLPEAGDEFAGSDRELIARSLAFVVIGGPVLFLIGRFTRTRLREDPTERTSLGWSLYLTVTMVVAVLVVMVAGFQTLQWAFDLEPFDGGALARGLVWAGVWAIHWPLTRTMLPERRNQLHLLFGSAAGLIGSAVAAGIGLTAIFAAGYDAAAETVAVGGYAEDLQTALAGMVVSVPVFAWYWLRNTVAGARTPAWNVYVVLLGVLGGFITMVGSVGTLLFVFLDWIFGSSTASAANHFDVVPETTAVLLIGLAVYWYHRGVLRSDAADERTEISRIYDYILAAVGLVSALGGVTTVIVALIEAIAGPGIAGGDAVETLLGAVTLLLVGAPLWWFFWTRIQDHAENAPELELRSPTRRAYLFLSFGIGAVVAVINLIILAFIAFEDVIEGTFDGDTLYSMRVPIALVLTVGGMAFYHWSIHREDRERAPARTHVLREVLVVSADGRQVAAEIAQQTGARVKVWKRLDQADGLEAAEVTAALADVAHERVLVLAGPAGVEVVPFED